MGKRKWWKIHPKYKKSTTKINVKYISLAVLAACGAVVVHGAPSQTHAESCPDLKVIFARGSSGERWTSGHYLAFREAMEEKLKTSNLTYEFEDLDYPAIGVGDIGVLTRAYIGGGDSYEFGESVHQGIDNLAREVNTSSCKNTKYVLAGYSQGALVVPEALGEIDADKVVYAAMFGDPKIYLPEGAGAVPIACKGEGLSEYRVYVPDCRAYKGLMGARDPYVLDGYAGKVGTWCNKQDIFCSSHFSITSHTHYVEDGLYEDASRFIFSKIAAEFGFENEYTSPHDTAILIDSTGSMYDLIDKYKTEAMNLAEQTLEAGGRVALYDYRDLGDGYEPVERCNFETCTVETFREGLDAIEADGGGDIPESLLSASIHVMQNLNWKLGSTKSLVILTDAGYHSPDLDGTTFYDVKKLSKEIDPVNFYIITTDENMEEYQSLAEATDGAVASSVSDLSQLTETIMARYDSLPRVEEEFETVDETAPTLEVTSVEAMSDSEVKVKFETDGVRTLVILNDMVMGVTESHELTVGELNASVENTLKLVPLSESIRGETVAVNLGETGGYGGSVAASMRAGADSTTEVVYLADGVILPKAPNTGRK